MTRQVFWITNGVYRESEYRVVVNVDLISYCNHCYKKHVKGFKAVGGYENYQICSRCLYQPSVEMVQQLFINVKRSGDESTWNKFLDKCANKEAYFVMVSKHQGKDFYLDKTKVCMN